MNKYISTDELKEWIENWFTKNKYYHPYSKSNNIPITELYDILEQIPEKSGHMITEEEAIARDDYTLAYTCSVCGHCDWDCTESEYFNYCPNCGAKMKKEKKDE